MLEILDTFVRPFFAVAALIYIGLGIRVSRSGPEYANNIVAFFLALLGVYVLGGAFSYNAEDSGIYGAGRVLTFGSMGFMPLTFYLIYRQFTVGPPRPIVVVVLSVIPIVTTGLAMTNSMHNMLWLSLIHISEPTRLQ